MSFNIGQSAKIHSFALRNDECEELQDENSPPKQLVD